MTQFFQPKYHKTTPAGEMNFIGTVQDFFAQYTQQCTEETKNTYISDYNNRIFPLINPALSIESYTQSTVNELMNAIQQTYGYQDSTMKSRTIHLLLDPIDAYYDKVGPYRNPLYGSSLRFENGDKEDPKSRLLRIKKSFSIAEELAVANALLCDPQTENGALVGLAVMFLSGSRNAETCGYNFKDLVEMREHPGSYFLRMYKTTVKERNDLKVGGKTSNASRNIPIPAVLSDFLLRRKAYIESRVSFPFQAENGETFTCVEDLPIACRANKFWDRSDISDLSAAGRKLLRENIKMSQADMGGINYLIEQEVGTEEDLGEREPTTYLFRRNMATHLYTLGFQLTQIQYYMGHMLEATPLERRDFVDEALLYEMWCLLQAHPLNRRQTDKVVLTGSRATMENRYHVSISVPFSAAGDSYRMRIDGREWNDPVTLHLDGTASCNVVLHIDQYDKRPGTEINVTKAIHASYDSKR